MARAEAWPLDRYLWSVSDMTDVRVAKSLSAKYWQIDPYHLFRYSLMNKDIGNDTSCIFSWPFTPTLISGQHCALKFDMTFGVKRATVFKHLCHGPYPDRRLAKFSSFNKHDLESANIQPTSMLFELDWWYTPLLIFASSLHRVRPCIQPSLSRGDVLVPSVQNGQ